jgi:RNA polymerase primary sigma factor
LEEAGEFVDAAPNAEHLVSLIERRRVLREQIDTLEEREQRVLCLRFGLDGEEEAGRDELGKVFCLTRERIRQIEKQAIERLQHPSRAAILLAV